MSADEAHDNGKRDQVRVDRFEMLKLTRRDGLSPTYYVVLDVLVRLASWRTAEWAGTFKELSEEVHVRPHTIRAAYDRLVDLEVLLELEPFTRGHGGRVLVLVYRDLVVLTEKADQALRTHIAHVQNRHCAMPETTLRAGESNVVAMTPQCHRNDAAASEAPLRTAPTSGDADAPRNRAAKGRRKRALAARARDDERPLEEEQSERPFDKPTLGGLRLAAQDPKRFTR
jgi:hypothetical protein